MIIKMIRKGKSRHSDTIEIRDNDGRAVYFFRGDLSELVEALRSWYENPGEKT